MKVIVAFLAIISTSCGALALERATPESQGVSSRAIQTWIDACERELDALHGFVIVRHGRTIAEGTWAPFDTLTKPHMLYSHSKSFTSTAIGFLVDEGKLDLDERVVKILPDKAPEQPSERMRELRVRDLLTMNVGADYTDAERKDLKGDWAKLFLSNDIQVDPGTRFKYDSCATYMLAEIVERRSGKKLMEFLNERLFAPLGITGAWSGVSSTGVACGGWGMNLTTRDQAKFGQLYLNGGVWHGKRLLSQEWIVLATARQTWSGAIAVTGEDGSDWHQGYGFQFWRCRHGAYRADGASGQFTIVMPEQDAVVSLHAGVGNMQKELNLVWQYLLPAFGKAALAEDPAAQAELARRCAALSLKPLSGAAAASPLPFSGTFKDAVFGERSAELTRVDAGWRLSFDGRRLAVGDGAWAKTDWLFSDSLFEPLFWLTGTREVAASGAWVEPNVFRVKWYVLGGIQRGTFDVKSL